MDTRRQTMNLIEMLETSELLLSQLYDAFSRRYKSQKVLWNEMAHEEGKHAGMIRALEQQVADGFLQLDNDRFDSTSIQMFHDYVKVLLSKAGMKAMSLDRAFEAALAVEHDLIERRFFDVFDADSPELKLILEALASATKEHRKRLMAAMEAYKKSRSRR